MSLIPFGGMLLRKQKHYQIIGEAIYHIHRRRGWAFPGWYLQSHERMCGYVQVSISEDSPLSWTEETHWAGMATVGLWEDIRQDLQMMGDQRGGALIPKAVGRSPRGEWPWKSRREGFPDLSPWSPRGEAGEGPDHLLSSWTDNRPFREKLAQERQRHVMPHAKGAIHRCFLLNKYTKESSILKENKRGLLVSTFIIFLSLQPSDAGVCWTTSWHLVNFHSSGGRNNTILTKI